MAEIVSDNDELLTLILLCLPARAILRFKSVSKHWKALVTDPYFMCRHFNLHQLSPSLLFNLYRSGSQYSSVNTGYGYLPLDDDLAQVPPPFTTQKHPKNLKIRQSCNGLLLCTTRSRDCKHEYHHVYNPTTNQFTTIPTYDLFSTELTSYQNLSLAFDPTRSPHYKIVHWSRSKSEPLKYRITIYSSETRRWQVHGEPFIADYKEKIFTKGIYSNGAVHWIKTLEHDFVNWYFNIEEGRIGILPTPPKVSYPPYLKAWKDHLHLVNMYYPPRTKFEVYELQQDYSNWFVKYQVDVGHVVSTFAYGSDQYAYPLLIVRGQREEDSYLVLKFEDDTLVRYNVFDKTFKKLTISVHEMKRKGDFYNSKAYIESLYPV